MPGHVVFWLEIAAALGSFAFCLLKGGAAERAGISLIIASGVVAELGFYLSRPLFPTTLVFACDFALASGLLVIAVRYGSLWLGCAMLVQSVIICSEGMSLSDDGLSNHSQSVLNDTLSMVMLACVVVSAGLTWRRRIQDRRDLPKTGLLPVSRTA